VSVTPYLYPYVRGAESSRTSLTPNGDINMMPSLQDIKTSERVLIAQIESEIKALPTLKAKLEEAKAKLQASRYAEAKVCTECNGAGRYMASYCVGYDEYDHDEELCDHCVMEGVYPWDINREWFDEEAAKASLDPTLDEDEREDELNDLLRDQAWEVEILPPQVVKDYDDANWRLSSELFSIDQNLHLLDHHYDTKGGGNQEWVATQLERINKIIEEYNFDSREGMLPRG